MSFVVPDTISYCGSIPGSNEGEGVSNYGASATVSNCPFQCNQLHCRYVNALGAVVLASLLFDCCLTQIP